MVWGEGLVPWVFFLLSAAVIVYAGTKLSHYGDQIATLTGPGRVADWRRPDGWRDLTS